MTRAEAVSQARANRARVEAALAAEVERDAMEETTMSNETRELAELQLAEPRRDRRREQGGVMRRPEVLQREARESYQRGLAEGREQGRAEERARWQAKWKELRDLVDLAQLAPRGGDHVDRALCGASALLREVPR